MSELFGNLIVGFLRDSLYVLVVPRDGSQCMFAYMFRGQAARRLIDLLLFFSISVHVPSGEKHLVILKEGPGKTLKIVSLSKVTEATDKDISFTVYDHSSR